MHCVAINGFSDRSLAAARQLLTSFEEVAGLKQQRKAKAAKLREQKEIEAEVVAACEAGDANLLQAVLERHAPGAGRDGPGTEKNAAISCGHALLGCLEAAARSKEQKQAEAMLIAACEAGKEEPLRAALEKYASRGSGDGSSKCIQRPTESNAVFNYATAFLRRIEKEKAILANQRIHEEIALKKACSSGDPEALNVEIAFCATIDGFNPSLLQAAQKLVSRWVRARTLLASSPVPHGFFDKARQQMRRLEAMDNPTPASATRRDTQTITNATGLRQKCPPLYARRQDSASSGERVGASVENIFATSMGAREALAEIHTASRCRVFDVAYQYEQHTKRAVGLS